MANNISRNDITILYEVGLGTKEGESWRDAMAQARDLGFCTPAGPVRSVLHGPDGSQTEQIVVAGDKGQIHDLSRSGEKPVSRVAALASSSESFNATPRPSLRNPGPAQHHGSLKGCSILILGPAGSTGLASSLAPEVAISSYRGENQRVTILVIDCGRTNPLGDNS